MNLLDPEERRQLAPAETGSYPSPIPTQHVSSDEFMPVAQTPSQRRVESRIRALGGELARKQGMTRRRFFQTAAGMAAAFVAMNEVYGRLFEASPAEAQTPEMAQERAKALSRQFVMDCHTHFLRDDTRITGFVRQREAVGKAGWNPALAGKPQTIEDLKFANYYKEIFLDSDTKVALISGAPSDVVQDWFLTNEMKAEARARVNREAGSRRMLSHAIFTPGQPGWLEAVDRAIEDWKPDSFKGYTIGDNTHKELSKYPWRMDDEKVAYKAYEKFQKAGLVNVCVHKGLFPPSVEKQYPHLLAHANVDDVARAAKDWPRLNFVIYHSAYRFAGGGKVDDAWATVREDRSHRVGDRSRGDSRQARRRQRVRRPRADLRPEHGGRPAGVRGHDGPARPRDGRRPRRVGHRRHLDGIAPVADRGAPPAGDPRGHAEEVRVQAARAGRRAGEERHPRREQRAPLQVRAARRPSPPTASPPPRRSTRRAGRRAATCATATSSTRRLAPARRPDPWHQPPPSSATSASTSPISRAWRSSTPACSAWS